MSADFTCTDHGGTIATIETHNWIATQWVAANVEEHEFVVIGGVYGTITGEPREMLEIALAMKNAGFRPS
jgi:hypothetical protein